MVINLQLNTISCQLAQLTTEIAEIKQQLTDLTNRIDHLDAITRTSPRIVPSKYIPPYPWVRREDDPKPPRKPWQGPRIDRWGRR